MASNGGKDCNGEVKETTSCNTNACPVDCRWGVFGRWSSCSKSCGGGVKTRSRSKLTLASNGGRECEGVSSETNSCSTQTCPVDCKWGSFGSWSSCSKTCGGGEKTRSRSKLILASNGGRECVGGSSETNSCHTQNCPVDCKWGDYGDWSLCSKTCGEGEKVRTRSKSIEASNGGTECEGTTAETVICNDQLCSGNQKNIRTSFIYRLSVDIGFKYSNIFLFDLALTSTGASTSKTNGNRL